MSDIQQTITAALPREAARYEQYIQPVVAALVEREQGITDAIVSAAVQHRVISSKEQGEDLARNFGLSVRPAPEPEPEVRAEAQAEDTTSLSLVAAVQQAVDNAVAPLVAFARQHGYRG